MSVGNVGLETADRVDEAGTTGTDLFERAPFVRRLVRSRSFQFLLIYPNFLVFYLLVLAGIFGHPLGNVNA
ncbi:MAG: hypothetical protein HY658_08020, partial [Actinobacteria bacterium]|nr:hypothetical protein [Actinomycetota bacterium]